MKTKKKRDIETPKSRAAFSRKLRRMADAIEKKEPIEIQVAGERFSIPVDCKFSIEHEREGDNEELEFQMRWQNPSS